MSRVVMLAGPGDSTNIVYHAIQPELVILESRPSYIQFLSRRAQKLGWSTVIGQVCFRSVIVPLLRWSSHARVRQIKAQNELNDAPIPHEKVLSVRSINENAAISALKRANPHVVVVNGTRIIADRVLRSVAATFLNTHAGITPLYRGVHGGYWALASGDRENCGVTVHVVDVGIDTGEVICQVPIQPTAEDNFVSYSYLQLAAAIGPLKQAVQDALSGTLIRRLPPPGKSRLWTHPTALQYLRNRRKGVK